MADHNHFQSRWFTASHRRPWRLLAGFVLLGFVLLNVLAYRHAGAMLTYQSGGERPPAPGSLSWSEKLRVLACGVTVPRPTNRRTPQELGLQGKPIRFQAADGVNLEGWVISPPEPHGTVLLFHGYSASRSTMIDEADEFFELGYAVVLIDFRGCGGSDGTTTTLGYREAADVAAAVEQTRSLNLPRPIILFGPSMGGAAILRSIAVHNVRPDAVIIESVFGSMAGAVRNRFDVMRVPSFPAAELLVFWGGVQVGFSGFEHNPVDYARFCAMPTLVLHGDADRMARPVEGRAIYDALTGPKELAWFAGADHVAMHSADPERWRTVVSHFLNRHIPNSVTEKMPR